MNPRLLILLAMVFVLVLCVGPVVGLRENFQDYGYSDITVIRSGTPYLSSSSLGTVVLFSDLASGGSGLGGGFKNTLPTPLTYAAIDYSPFGIGCGGGTCYDLNIDLYDSSNTLMVHYAAPISGRIELKMIGGTPTVYINGVQYATMAVQSQNPSYIYFYIGGTYNRQAYYDNVVMGESDHHIVGALPSNWTIQRDLLNPSATGVYAQNPITGVWSVANSYYFYIDASKEYLLQENVVIKEYMTGTVVNTTSVSGVGNRIAYNISAFLSNPTSLGTTLPDGKYTVSFESSPLIYDDFWVISSGATMSFNKVRYSTGESAAITYTISPTYFIGDYTYKMDMQDVYGNVIESQALTSASGTRTFVTNAVSYPPGVYYGVIRATKISDGSVSIMAYSGMETVACILWNGYVMNAENGSVISGAYVNVTQLGTTLQSQSLSSGAWNSSNNWIPSNQFNITTIKSGYTTDVRLLTPLGTTGINLNISLVPLPPLNVSTSIGGIVRDNVYGNPIPNATVSGVNNTLTRTNLTNIAGYYRVDNMKLPDVVNMSAAKTGYVNDTALGFLDASVATSFTRKDLILDPVFSFTLNIVDSATSMPIPVVGVLDSLGNNQTTTTGVFVESYPYSSVVLYLTSTGYNSKSVSYIIDSNRVETVDMVKSSTQGNKNTWYSPKQISITVLSYATTNKVANANITLKAIGTSLQDNTQLQTVYGVDPEAANQMVNGTLLMNSFTGTDGAAVFTVLGSIRYTAYVTDPTDNKVYTTNINPGLDPYNVWIGVSPLTVIPSAQDYTNNTRLYLTQPDPANLTLNLRYQDTSGKTTNVVFSVEAAANMTTIYTQDLGNPGIGVVLANKTYPNVRGVGYWARYNATRSI
jgi:hypothetical protein